MMTRTIAADHPDRVLVSAPTMVPVFLRIDPTHELPIVVETDDGEVIARFSRPGDAALLTSREGNSLPRPIVVQLERLLAEKAGQGSLDIPARPR